MIRLPSEITEAERVKPEPWANVIGKGLIVVSIVLWLVYFFFPLMDGQ